MIYIFHTFLKTLFPPRCIFCNTILSVDIECEICDNCYRNIPFMPGDSFAKGNLAMNRYYDGVVCVCEYSDIIKQSLIKYKFFNRPSYYRAFASLLSNKIKNMTYFRNFDIIISVPLHKSKQKSRGYNQALLISRALSKKTGIPDKSWLLSRTRDTGSQSLLAKKQRGINVKNAFNITNIDKIRGKSILLIDDIFTTGSTANECSRVLKEAGALSIVVCVIASGRKY